MRCFLGAATLVAVHAQTCQEAATAWFTSNSWIVGQPAQQLAGVEDLCCGAAGAGSNGDGINAATCATQDAMTAQLENIASVCGAGDEAITEVTNLVKELMCSSHDGVYCLTNVLAFIDFNLLGQITQGAYLDLGLDNLLANDARRAALCSSENCRYEVFRKVSMALKGIEGASLLWDIARDVRCGCANDDAGVPCFGQDSFLASGDLDLDNSCANGELTKCARVNAQCLDRDFDPAICRDTTVEMEQVASFTINFGNIQYSFYEANQAALVAALNSDFADNLIGLLAGDCEFEFVEAADGSLSINVKIKGEVLDTLLGLREMLESAADRASLQIFVLDRLENEVPESARLIAGEALGSDVSITDIEITEQEVDSSAALPLAAGAAALASCAL